MSLEIIKKYNIKAKKSLGQNFLVNEAVVEEISSSINVKGENIIEVGPGYGALTQKLLNKRPLSLTLIELDNEMIEILEKRLQNGDFDLDGVDFKIKNIDVLKFNPEIDNYSVIANIPYYITSPILRHFLYDVENTPKKMLILMQKDVGDKITGREKNKSSVLSLFIAKKCYVREILFVGKQNFVPAPKVESSVILFEKHDLYKNIDDKKFLNLIKKAFKEPRKKLLKNFVNSGYDKQQVLEVFSSLDIDEAVRGEDLDIDTWIKLTESI